VREKERQGGVKETEMKRWKVKAKKERERRERV
jgi:hypothetical protein